MPSTTVVLTLLTVVLVGLVLFSALRRGRDLEPPRLGPTWTPRVDPDTEPVRDPAVVAARADEVAARTGTDREVVTQVLDVWDEYLALIGLTTLPATHQPIVYDPYDRPLAQRDPLGRPVPDRERVARDIGQRLDIPEVVAREVLDAVDDAPDPA